MTKVTVFSPTIEDLLHDFFPAFRPNADAAMRTRIEFVRSDLWLHLDKEGSRVLNESQRAIVNAEKQVDPGGAFARTMHADDLYYCLEHYLEPAHEMLGIDQRRVQLDVIAALITHVRDLPRVMAKVSECCSIELDLALKRAQVALNGAIGFEKDLSAGKL